MAKEELFLYVETGTIKVHGAGLGPSATAGNVYPLPSPGGAKRIIRLRLKTRFPLSVPVKFSIWANYDAFKNNPANPNQSIPTVVNPAAPPVAAIPAGSRQIYRFDNSNGGVAHNRQRIREFVKHTPPKQGGGAKQKARRQSARKDSRALAFARHPYVITIVK